MGGDYTTPRRRAVFLDRDGTINVDTNFLIRPEDLQFIPGAQEAIAKLNQAGFLVVVVTNQSGIARGYFSMEDVHKLHSYIQNELTLFGATIDSFYICPHHPKYKGEQEEECSCRKGKPGMLLQAAEELNIDLIQSVMIGDKRSDLEAGMAAGCQCYLVRTGYGEKYLDFASENNIPISVDLLKAVEELLGC